MLKYFAMLLIAFLLTSAVSADDIMSVTNIPNVSWDNYDGCAVALDASSMTNTNGTLNIYIKNTSNYIKYFNPNVGDSGIKIYYIDLENKEISLHDYTDSRSSNRPMVRGPKLLPGATICVSIEVEPQDAALLKQFPVKYNFTLFKKIDPKGFENLNTTSTPKKLTIP